MATNAQSTTSTKNHTPLPFDPAAAGARALAFARESLNLHAGEPYADGHLFHFELNGNPLPPLFAPAGGREMAWLKTPPIDGLLPAGAVILDAVCIKAGDSPLTRPGVSYVLCPQLAVICTNPADSYGWAVIHIPRKIGLTANIPNFATAWALLKAYADGGIDWTQTDPAYYGRETTKQRRFQAEFHAPVFD